MTATATHRGVRMAAVTLIALGVWLVCAEGLARRPAAVRLQSSSARRAPPPRPPKTSSWRLPGPLRRVARRVQNSRHWPRRLGGRLADMVVVSDLHLGEGKHAGRWSKREHFRAQRHFDDMVSYLLRRQRRAGGRRLKLVLAGDTIDFLLVVRPPRGERIGAPGPRRDHSPTASIALQKLRRVAGQHRPFFSTLRRVLRDGHDVVINIGNHDQELSFPAVQRELRKLVTGGHRAGGKLTIEPLLHVHGQVLVEHGHRYDAVNNVKFPLHPFKTDSAGQRRLRPAAGSYFVAEVVNKVRERLPAQMRVRAIADLWQYLRRAPRALGNIVGWAATMSDRTGPLAPGDEQRMRRAHRAVFDRIAGSKQLRQAINDSRRAHGKPPLSKRQVRQLMERYQDLEAEPFLHSKPKKELRTRLRQAARMLAPGTLATWLNPRRGSTLREGQAFVLEHLANVMVTGHTHHPFHYQLRRAGRVQHLVNSGTWVPASSPTGKLTFVDIRQTDARPRVLLRRWSVEKGRPVRLEHRTFAEGQFPSKAQVH